MSQESLGLIETIGLAAAIAAADAAVKSANVTLVGYELSKGDGMAVVKLRGDVGAVQAAISAAQAEAARVGQVVATRVIARPSLDLTKIVDSRETVGIKRPEPTRAEPVATAVQEEPSAAPAPTPQVVETAPSETSGQAETPASPVIEPTFAEPTAYGNPPPPTDVSEPIDLPQSTPPQRPDRHQRRR
ncbi:BMC domain-containing protein [Tianweitania populi]|uniref:Microcompartment protein n=1 Tax=Tianweitania populi TaxID=1607949 RepID=A0A8J3DPH0_9HYPH|nr:BMC domain-containing protein [Tianweitania populi]GHD12362.1 microcompartment protein [Tianweitania populi]